MKRIFLILCLMMICNTSYADIASTGYVDGVVDSLPTVAKTGSYNDLSNKPTIPTVPTNISSFTNDSGYITNSYHDSTKQDKLPTGPSGGRYNLVWNGNTGNFVFELVPGSCPSGTYDIGFSQCIDPGPNGSAYGFMNDSTGANGAWTSNTATYGLTTDQTWGTTLYTGDKVTGIASCNSTPGTWATPTNENFNQTDKGQYCWCKMTEPAVSRWVFHGDRDDAANCANNCANFCGYSVGERAAVRSGVFSSVGQ